MRDIDFSPPSSERVCVVIPCFCVAPFIEDVIRRIPKWVHRIIAVDDRSPDETVTILEKLEDARLLTLRHAENRGVGQAMLTGYRKALEEDASVIVKMDGDGQMPVEYLDLLVRPLLEGKADYVKANRFAQVGALQQMPRIRRLGNIGLSFLTKAASGYWNVFDPNNGYTAIDGDILARLDDKHIHRRYCFESSMLTELNLLRAVVVDVEVPARYGDEESYLSVLRSTFEFPLLLVRMMLRRIWQTYFVRDFNVASLFLVVGLVLMLFGGIWGAVFWALSIRSGIPATTGTVMISVLPLILGFQLLLQFIVFDIQNVPTLVRSSRSASSGPPARVRSD